MGVTQDFSLLSADYWEQLEQKVSQYDDENPLGLSPAMHFAFRSYMTFLVVVSILSSQFSLWVLKTKYLAPLPCVPLLRQLLCLNILLCCTGPLYVLLAQAHGFYIHTDTTYMCFLLLWLHNFALVAVAWTVMWIITERLTSMTRSRTNSLFTSGRVRWVLYIAAVVSVMGLLCSNIRTTKHNHAYPMCNPWWNNEYTETAFLSVWYLVSNVALVPGFFMLPPLVMILVHQAVFKKLLRKKVDTLDRERAMILELRVTRRLKFVTSGFAVAVLYFVTLVPLMTFVLVAPGQMKFTTDTRDTPDNASKVMKYPDYIEQRMPSEPHRLTQDEKFRNSIYNPNRQKPATPPNSFPEHIQIHKKVNIQIHLPPNRENGMDEAAKQPSEKTNITSTSLGTRIDQTIPELRKKDDVFHHIWKHNHTGVLPAHVPRGVKSNTAESAVTTKRNIVGEYIKEKTPEEKDSVTVSSEAIVAGARSALSESATHMVERRVAAGGGGTGDSPAKNGHIKDGSEEGEDYLPVDGVLHANGGQGKTRDSKDGKTNAAYNSDSFKKEHGYDDWTDNLVFMILANKARLSYLIHVSRTDTEAALWMLGYTFCVMLVPLLLATEVLFRRETAVRWERLLRILRLRGEPRYREFADVRDRWELDPQDSLFSIHDYHYHTDDHDTPRAGTDGVELTEISAGTTLVQELEPPRKSDPGECTRLNGAARDVTPAGAIKVSVQHTPLRLPLKSEQRVASEQPVTTERPMTSEQPIEQKVQDVAADVESSVNAPRQSEISGTQEKNINITATPGVATQQEGTTKPEVTAKGEVIAKPDGIAKKEAIVTADVTVKQEVTAKPEVTTSQGVNNKPKPEVNGLSEVKSITQTPGQKERSLALGTAYLMKSPRTSLGEKLRGRKKAKQSLDDPEADMDGGDGYDAHSEGSSEKVKPHSATPERKKLQHNNVSGTSALPPVPPKKHKAPKEKMPPVDSTQDSTTPMPPEVTLPVQISTSSGSNARSPKPIKFTVVNFGEDDTDQTNILKSSKSRSPPPPAMTSPLVTSHYNHSDVSHAEKGKQPKHGKTPDTKTDDAQPDGTDASPETMLSPTQVWTVVGAPGVLEGSRDEVLKIHSHGKRDPPPDQHATDDTTVKKQSALGRIHAQHKSNSSEGHFIHFKAAGMDESLPKKQSPLADIPKKEENQPKITEEVHDEPIESHGVDMSQANLTQAKSPNTPKRMRSIKAGNALVANGAAEDVKSSDPSKDNPSSSPAEISPVQPAAMLDGRQHDAEDATVDEALSSKDKPTPPEGTPIAPTPLTGTPITPTPTMGMPITPTPVTGTPITPTSRGMPITPTPFMQAAHLESKSPPLD